PLESRESLIGRDEQLAALAEALAQRTDAVVDGPPRHGKTSLVNAALAEVATQGAVVALRVDCAGVVTVADLARRVEEACATGWASGSLEARFVERLEAA